MNHSLLTRGHRFERGNSYGPQKGGLWHFFDGNVDVFTNVFTCIGLKSSVVTMNNRCIDNGGVAGTKAGNTFYTFTDYFARLDFYLLLRDGFTWDAFTPTFLRGRTFRFPLDDTEKRTRFWLLFSEQVERNVGPLFDYYGIVVSTDLLYEQILLTDGVTVALRFSATITDISGVSNTGLTASGITTAQANPPRLFSTSASGLFTASSTLNIALRTPPLAALSVSFWIQPQAITAGTIVQYAAGTTVNWKVALLASGALSFTWGSNPAFTSPDILSANAWYHVVFTADAQFIKIYLNGAPSMSALTTTALSSNAASSKLVINPLAAPMPTMYLAEVAVFTTVLPATRVAAQYAPSPFGFKPWLNPRYMPAAISGCDVIPPAITACNTKTGVQGSGCTSCLAYRCNNAAAPVGEDCSDVCSIGTAVDAISGTCKACHATCRSCSVHSNPSRCLTCNSASSFPFFYQGSCIAACPAGTYNDNGICKNCDASCLTCNGPNSGNCLTCRPAEFFYQNTCVASCPVSTVTQGSQCVASCVEGYYPDGSRICRRCEASCKTCNGPLASNCLSCEATGAVPLYNSALRTCSGTCDPGYFNPSNTYLCNACDASCQTCSGSASTCTTCDPVGTTPYFFLGTCVAACPAFTTLNAAFECEGCDINGATPYSREGQCVSACEPGEVIYRYTCQASCPNQFFTNEQSVCTACSANCNTCETSSTRCTSCAGATPLIYQNQCYSECPSETFANSNVCQDCHTSCSECNGASSTSCISCASPNPILYEGACITSCPDGMFFSDVDDTCIDCEASCATCSDENTCDTCPASTFMSTGDICVSNCPDGTFANQNTQSCSPCDLSCLTCTGSASTCSSCDPNGPLPVLDGNTCEAACTGVLLGEDCLAQCPVNRYYEAGGICQPCSSDCLSCSGSPTHCTNCDLSGPKPIYIASDSRCIATCSEIGLIAFDSACVDVCPVGFYNNLGTCVSCSANCHSCSSANACTACKVALPYLIDGQCVEACPQRYVADNNNVCVSCAPNCILCSSSAANGCTQCETGYEFDAQRNCVEESCNELSAWSIDQVGQIEDRDMRTDLSNFDQRMLCFDGTAGSQCIALGSDLQGDLLVQWRFETSLSCSHECTSGSQVTVSQQFSFVVGIQQSILEIRSLVDTSLTVQNQFYEASSRLLPTSTIYQTLRSNALQTFANQLSNVALCATANNQLPAQQLTRQSLQMAPLGSNSLTTCSISQLPANWNTQAGFLPRCVCDSTVAGDNACSQIRFEPFLSAQDSVCHPNHCTNSAMGDYVSIEFDTDFYSFGDANLQLAIEVINQWIVNLRLSSFRFARVFRVNKASVILVVDILDTATSSTDNNSLYALYDALQAQALEFQFPVIDSQISLPLRSTTPSRTPITLATRSLTPTITASPVLTSTGTRTRVADNRIANYLHYLSVIAIIQSGNFFGLLNWQSDC